MLDISKPVQVRANNDRILKARIVSTVGPFDRPIVCVCDDYWRDGKECVMTFPVEGSMKGDSFVLENIPPEPKVTEVPIWRDLLGAVFVSTLNRTVNWSVGLNCIGTLRITETEGQPLKVEVV